MSSPNFATTAPKVDASAVEDVEALVQRLHANKDAWVRTPIERRIALLRSCIEHTRRIAHEWVEAGCRAKGLDPNSPRAGDEWLGGPMTTIRNMRLLAESLEQGGHPAASEVRKRPNGQWVATVYPSTTLESIMLPGFRAEVWIEPGEAPTQGRIYREKALGNLQPGKVSLVLGAGNVASIGPMDALHKLFVEDEVVIVKTNPVNAYLQPFWEESFRPLIREGVVGIVRGGADVGSRLVHHPKVDTIHMTGSDRTYDAIVWGANPAEQARRKASGDKLVDKPITSELGAVTPVLVVPGPWSADDIEFQAQHVAGMVTQNASFNCNAAKVIVTADRWPEREAFLKAIEKVLKDSPPRRAYYPGAQDRYDGFLERYPKAKALGPRSASVVPWTIVPNVPPIKGEHALTSEAFCGVLAETRLPAKGPGEFIEAMVDFANDVCWGTLSCMILIHPDTQKAYARQLDSAIERLRYGGIAVNAWAGVVYGLVSPTWGAFPGHPPEDIQSGNGTVHNTYLFDHPQRSVVWAPFRQSPKPAYAAGHKSAHLLGERLTELEASPSLLKIPSLFLAARKA